MLERIGHYRIVSELGRGGMGVVYKAHEESLNRFVAIKTLGQHLEEDDSYVQRFVREAQSAAKLNHPNIVQIYSINEDEGQHYFVMEYVSGTSIQRLVRSDGRMEMGRAARIVLQTSAGLAAAHEQGVIHRDIKPANLMITEKGLVKIADFGLALLAGGASRLTATGMFMGTPGYLSPEQCLDKDVDHRTDIYSLGVTFYEMLTGSVPFKADSPLALLRQIIEVEPPDVRELNPEVDDEARDLLVRMMAKERDERFSSCDEIIDELQGYLDAKGLASQDAAAVAAGTSPAVAVPTTVAPAAPVDTDRLVTLNNSPTMMVDSAEGVAPPPPPPVTAPAAVAAEPAVEEIIQPPAHPAAQGRHTALIIMVVVVIALAGLVGASAVAWKSGLLAKLTGSGADRATPATSQQAALLEDPGSEPPGDQSAAGPPTTGGTTSQAIEEVASGATTSQSPDIVAPVDTDERATPERRDAPAQEVVPPPPEPRRQEPAAAADSQPDEVVTVPRPTGVIVVGVGERLLAGEAETYIENALARSGLEVVDEKSIAEIFDLANSDEARATLWISVLRPFAAQLVFVHADYLGDRPLAHLGGRDVVFTSRLRIVPFDLEDGQPLGPGMDTKVEYNQLTVERRVAETLRRPVRRLSEGLARQQ